MQKEKTSRKTLTQNVNGRTAGWTNEWTDEWMERRKLYTPRHTSYAGGIITTDVYLANHKGQQITSSENWVFVLSVLLFWYRVTQQFLLPEETDKKATTCMCKVGKVWIQPASDSMWTFAFQEELIVK